MAEEKRNEITEIRERKDRKMTDKIMGRKRTEVREKTQR